MVKPFKATLFLVCFMLFASSTFVDFHPPKIVQLEIKESISEIIAINATTFAVRTASEVLILEGPSFEKKEKKFRFDGPAKLTKEGVGSIQAQGSYFQLSRFEEKNITILESNLNSDMLVTSKYALFGKGEQTQPTLVKLDLETIKLYTFTYPRASGRYGPSLLVDLQNGDLAISAGYELLILNNETLELKQTLPAADVIDDVRCIFAYYDEKKNESNYLVGRNGNSIVVSEIKKDLSGKYVPEERFNTYDASSYQFRLTMTGVDTAIRFDFCDIEYWSNFHSIVSVSYDMKYYLRQRQKAAVSNNESFFVVRNDTGYYEFYRIGDDYDVTRFQALYVSFNQLRKGKTTSDDKSLFLSMSNTRSKHDVAKVDIQAGEFYFVTDQDGTSDNQFDFALFHTSHNRLVTLEFRGTSYYLQLRTLDTLSFIHEFPLKFDSVAEYKLISSNEWALTFGLATRIKPYYYDLENDTKLYLFKVEGDKIVSTGVSQDVTFNLLEPCSKYVISYKARFPLIRAFHFSNLSLAYAIPTYSQYQVGVNIEKNIMIISSGNSNSVINLDKSPERIGSFYTDSNPNFDYTISLILAQKGLLFATPPSIRFEHSMTKKFYNISSPTIKSRVSMNEQSFYSCNVATYYVPPQKTSQDCNSVFYIEYQNSGVYTKFPQLVRFSECSKTSEKYKVEEYGDYEVNTVIFISSDKKYVCILVNPWQIPEFMLEIRPIANLSQIIFHKVFEYYSSKYHYINEYHVDFINDSMILFHSPDFLTAYYIEPREFAHSHQMSAITHFDLTEQIVALAGPAIANPSKTNIVVKRLSSKNSLFTTEINSSITIIAVSPLGEIVAAYTENSQFKVWQILSNTLILNTKIEDVSKIEFKNEKQLSVEQKGHLRIFILGYEHERLNSASLIEETTANIAKLFQVPSNEKIIGVLNLKEETLTVTDKNKIYIWEKYNRQGNEKIGSLLISEE